MKIITFILLLSTNLLYSQNVEFDKEIFKDIYKIRCKGASVLHRFINGTRMFHFIDDNIEYHTTYKLNSEFNYNFFISVFNVGNSGFRVNTPNSFLYDSILKEGNFIEVHKEGNTSFLVYRFGEDIFLLNSSEDSRNRKHYIIDFWCRQ